jgi:hypothetical protein
MIWIIIIIIIIIIYFIVQNPSQNVYSCSVGQKVPSILWTQKIYCRV